MSKFNIGDRVRLISNRDRLRAGAVGVIADESSIPFVEWEGLTSGHDRPHGDGRMTMWAVDQDDLELLPHEFKAGELVTIARKVAWEGWVPSLDEYVGQSHKIQSIEVQEDKSHAFIDGWFFPVEALELARESWEMALESGEFTYDCKPWGNRYRAKREAGGWQMYAMGDTPIGSVHLYSLDQMKSFLRSGDWVVVDIPDTATIDSLCADYRKAQAVHTEALARSAAARQAYEDAEDELNSASDRLEAAGKAVLEAIAKQ